MFSCVVLRLQAQREWHTDSGHWIDLWGIYWVGHIDTIEDEDEVDELGDPMQWPWPWQVWDLNGDNRFDWL